VTRTASIAGDGPAAARSALEECVANGGVALFPADTLYGLGCDPSSPGAIERIRSLKGRDEKKPSAVIFFAPLAMRELLATLKPRTREAVGALLPGAVTLVVHNPECLYPLAGGDHPERLGIRLIEGPLTGAACAMLQTSANPSGHREPSRL
jgi:L-threonylcarbamoyladenylate synthase